MLLFKRIFHTSTEVGVCTIATGEPFLHAHLEYFHLGSHIHFFLFHKSFLFLDVNTMIFDSLFRWVMHYVFRPVSEGSGHISGCKVTK